MKQSRKMVASALAALALFLAANPQCEGSSHEVRIGSSSPNVTLILTLHSPKIKSGESLWYHIELKNTSNKPMPLVDGVLEDPTAMLRQSRAKVGIHLEVIDPYGGKTPAQNRPISVPHDPSESLLPPESDKEAAELRKRLEKAGKSKQEITRELFERSRRKSSTRPGHDRRIWLQPGESATTIPWNSQDAYERHYGRTPTGPKGRFTELDFWNILLPGKYKIRAVYNTMPPYAQAATARDKRDPRHMRIATPFIDFVVVLR